MRYRAWVWNGKAIEVHAGLWNAIPSTGIQKIHLLQDDGRVVEVSGFDRYYEADGVFGAVIDDEASPWARACKYAIPPGEKAEEVARWGEEEMRGALLEVGPGAAEKIGTFVSDEVAREIGIK
jgi:hypothetical protein